MYHRGADFSREFEGWSFLGFLSFGRTPVPMGEIIQCCSRAVKTIKILRILSGQGITRTHGRKIRKLYNSEGEGFE